MEKSLPCQGPKKDRRVMSQTVKRNCGKEEDKRALACGSKPVPSILSHNIQPYNPLVPPVPQNRPPYAMTDGRDGSFCGSNPSRSW